MHVYNTPDRCGSGLATMQWFKKTEINIFISTLIEINYRVIDDDYLLKCLCNTYIHHSRICSDSVACSHNHISRAHAFACPHFAGYIFARMSVIFTGDKSMTYALLFSVLNVPNHEI
jgi:hypothetical protein